VKIRDVLDNVLALFETQIHAAGARVSAEIDDEGEIRALPGEIRQVFANLIGNGLEALQDGQGRLRVRAYASKDWRRGGSGLRVVVADNGRGIPNEIREKIFDPFFTTKGESGTGLGLWIATGIIEKYGGTMRVRSTTREGRSGTCFSLFFPSELNEG
jgi:signal transduction histidine kinase